MFVFQSETQPNTVLNALREIFSPEMAGVRICSSYVSLEGSRLLYSEIASAADAKKLTIEVICALDFGITQPEAIEYWMKWANVYVAGYELLETGSLIPKTSAFHPKFYIAQGHPGMGAIALVGSANLTTRGLSVNTEAVMRVEDAANEQCFSEIWKSARTRAIPATEDLVGSYRELHKKRTPSPGEGDHESPSAPSATTTGGPLSQAGLDLEKYPIFWVQTAGMSGGRDTQIEMPRGGYQFFPGADTPNLKIRERQPLKKLDLTINGQKFSTEGLTWHGKNQMERLNVPSPMKCGIDWGKSLVVIKRLTHDHYSLRAYPWDSAPAKAVRRASAKLGLLFKVGKGNTKRVCGLLPEGN